jgi:hypothetical protein
MDRRDFIRLSGGGLLFGALPGCASQPDPGAAWSHPGAGETDPRKRALSWAILAPNPHNMQPWLADLSEPDVITLYVDRTRVLPVTDPFNRQITVGCGAFLELLRMAAAKDKLNAVIQPFPQGEGHPLLDERPVAQIMFREGAAPDPLFAYAPARRTNRSPYDEREISPPAAQVIVSAASVPMVSADATIEPARVARLSALAFRGSYVEVHTPPAHRESVARTFIGAKDIAAHRYGISIDGPAIEAAHTVGLLTQDRMATPGTFAYDQALAFLKKAADTARGWVWITTAGESRAEELAAGAAYLRANLAATGLGISMHPFSQVLQEYEAMNALRAEVHRELAPTGGRVQMFARIGYAKPVPPAPRRGLDQNLLVRA